MGHLSNELWIPLTSMVCTKTSQKEAFTYKAHISQMNPHFTSNHNPGFFSFLILSPTCLFPSSSPNKNSSLETDSLLISHLTNKLIMFSYFSCLFWERLNIYKAQQLLIFTPSKTNKRTKAVSYGTSLLLTFCLPVKQTIHAHQRPESFENFLFHRRPNLLLVHSTQAWWQHEIKCCVSRE